MLIMWNFKRKTIEMPIDYSKYPSNWKTEIRPSILQRGEMYGLEVYQDHDGNIYNADNSVSVGSDYVGEVHPTNKFIRVVLTVAHLNHDIKDNRSENLRALCQRCHNRHDKEYRKANRKKKQPELF